MFERHIATRRILRHDTFHVTGAARERTMAEEKQDRTVNAQAPDDLSRREFVAMSVAAGLAVAAGSASAAETPVVEANVQVKTADGSCDAAFIHPATGSH